MKLIAHFLRCINHILLYNQLPFLLIIIIRWKVMINQVLVDKIVKLFS